MQTRYRKKLEHEKIKKKATQQNENVLPHSQQNENVLPHSLPSAPTFEHEKNASMFPMSSLTVLPSSGKDHPSCRFIGPPAADKIYRGTKVLADLFYKPSSTAAFAPPLKLYKAAKKLDPFMTIQKVEHWLSRQPAYTQYRVNHQKFPRRKVVVRGMGWQFQADLMDMHNLSRENSGNKFILTVIDCFSRLATAIPIRSKHAKNVVEGMKRAFDQLGVPRKLQTDEGKEFYNSQMKVFLRQHDVILFSTDQELKAQIVERFNRTIRDKIKKYMRSAATLRYIDALPHLLHSYNYAKHRSLHGFSPAQVTKENEKTVFNHQYNPYLVKTFQGHRFKLGDHVRAFKRKFQLIKDLPTFEEDTFEIIDCLATNPPMYKLKRLSNGYVVRGAYYQNQLQKIWPDKNTAKREA